MATARRRTKGPVKGRAKVALGLAVFIIVALIVVWRRSLGVATANEMRTLEYERRQLTSERTTLERELNEASSRSRIVAEAEKRLGLHVAPESQTRSIADGVALAPVSPVTSPAAARP